MTDAPPTADRAPDLAGRVALVTGGAGGLGRAIAEHLGAAGARIVIGDVDVDATHACVAALRDLRIDAQARDLDVSRESSVTDCCAWLEQAYGRLDILVNNAGIVGLVDGRRPLVEDMPLALWQRTLDVNLTGAFLASRGAIGLMRRGRWGRIVNLSSRAGRMRTGRGHANYAATKAALIGFSRVVAGEVGRDGITVNCVAPSRVVTPMTRALADSDEAFARNVEETAVGALVEPRDVAAAVGFLCSDAARYITGTVLDVNGGSFMP